MDLALLVIGDAYAASGGCLSLLTVAPGGLLVLLGTAIYIADLGLDILITSTQLKV